VENAPEQTAKALRVCLAVHRGADNEQADNRERTSHFVAPSGLELVYFDGATLPIDCVCVNT
jgi:hypothetical protein